MRIYRRHTSLTRARLVMAALLMLVLGTLSPSPVFAHGGEDHGDAKPVAAAGIGPRLATGSDIFDLVALPTAKDGGKLRVYLSDASTNKSITGAQIEVTRGAATTKLVEGKGFYELDAPWVKTPAHHDLTFAITAGDASDLLIGTLDIPEPAATARHDSIWDHILPPGSGAVMPWVFAVVGTIGLLGIRRALPLGRPVRRIAAILTGVMIIGGVSLGSAGLVRSIAANVPTANAVLDQPDTARRLGDGAVFAPRTTQSLLEITTLRATEAQTAQKTVRLIGQVIPDLNRSGLVQSLLPGRIEAPEKGFYGIGSRVKAGDVLIEQDTRDAAALVAAQEAEFSALQKQLAESEVGLADKRDQWVRMEKLIATHVASEDERQRKRFAAQTAEAQFASTKARVASAEAQLHRTKVQLDLLTIRAPREGRILQVNIRAGEYASSTSLEPILILGQTEQLQLRADIDEDNASRVRPGMAAKAYIKGRRDVEIPLRFVRIEPFIVPKKSLTGESSEHVDTRVLQIIYRFDRPAVVGIYVGQQMDVFLDDGK